MVYRMHHNVACSVTSGSGERPRQEGCQSGVYSIFHGSLHSLGCMPIRTLQLGNTRKSSYGGLVVFVGPCWAKGVL